MKSQINLLKSEAEANYSASRWEDSAKTYEHLVGLAQENNDLSLAIDFAIAAIKAWSHLSDKQSRIYKLYQAIGIIGLKQAAIGFEEISIEEENRSNYKSAANYYEEAAEGYSYILNYEKAKDTYYSSLEVFNKLSKQALNEKDFENSIHLLNRICTLYSKVNMLIDSMLLKLKNIDERTSKQLLEEKNNINKNEKQTKIDIAKSHEYLAIQYLQRNDPEFLPVAEKEFSNAIKILESLNDTQELKRVKEKKIKLIGK